MKKHYRHETDCLNCGTELQGNFCHKCGQENLQMKESFGHMINHAVSDYFHFDYQFFHTLKPLFAKPGKLTVDYLEGRRAQYLHPVKMYIFISLIFFVLFFKQNGHEIVKEVPSNKSTRVLADTIKHNLAKDIDSDKSLTPADKAKIKQTINKFVPGAVKTIDTVQIAKAKSPAPAAKLADPDPKDYNGGIMLMDNKNDPDSYPEYLAQQNKLTEAQRDGIFTGYIKKKSYSWKSQGKNGLEMFREGLQHNAPKMMFLLLPLFAFILSIAFRKNRKFYVEHIIYAIHLHCFLFLFLAAEIVLKLIIPATWESVIEILDLVAFLGVTYYVYRSLRVVYNRSRWRTVSKMIGVSLAYFFVFGMCFLIVAAITAITTV
ncbi:DUF3667 domain-containing protein [Mucilaginibacter gilvus]|uniref:DUF3667 domain-containing protein n=1 Tax=Mucilaginibacter gilvus TaxID=2305909 RepID=A0A3S3W7E8_9SPHI|nr:DUF3667 domain-containing protein [Mucilaginibacter gilvus]RWY50145.1 DUF3667 domain-containing protein [Mucilaginibacter gilvus]